MAGVREGAHGARGPLAATAIGGAPAEAQMRGFKGAAGASEQLGSRRWQGTRLPARRSMSF